MDILVSTIPSYNHGLSKAPLRVYSWKSYDIMRSRITDRYTIQYYTKGGMGLGYRKGRSVALILQCGDDNNKDNDNNNKKQK